MGARGTIPTPSAILEKRGSWRSKVNKEEPLPQAMVPTAPDYLNRVALEMYQEITYELELMNVITRADKNVISRYCILYSRWLEAELYLQKRGSQTYPIKDKKGNVIGIKPFPEVKIASDLATQLLKIETHFGLNPSSRTRIRTEKVINAIGKSDEEEFFV